MDDKSIKPKVDPKVKLEMDDKIKAIELENIVDERLQELDPKPDIQILSRAYEDSGYDQNKLSERMEPRSSTSSGSTDQSMY